VVEANGTQDATSEDSGQTTDIKEVTVDPAVEELRKERDQARMRANQLENEAKQAKEAAAEAERKRLEEAGDYKAIAEQLQREKEERAAEEARKAQEAADKAEEDAKKARVDELRQEVLDQFPENIKELAKTLGIWWDEAGTEAEAQAQLKTKLEALQASQPAVEEQEPTIHANNPAGEVDGVPFQNLSLEEMRKQLPRADSR
jgi:arginyl-tRNA synthetase